MGSLGIAKSLRRAKPDIDELAAAFMKDKERAQREERAAAFNKMIQGKLHPKPQATYGTGPEGEVTGQPPAAGNIFGDLGDFDPTTPEFLSEVGKTLKRNPEDTLGDIIQSHLAKVKARKLSKKSVQQIVGKDGFYYNVVEDQQTGQTSYEKTDIEAPSSKVDNRAKTVPAGGYVLDEEAGDYKKVGESASEKTKLPEKLSPGDYYLDPKTGKYIQQGKPKEEKETYQTSFIKPDGTITTKRYTGTPQIVAKGMRARLKAITDIIKDLENTQGDEETLQNYRRELSELNTNLEELQEGEEPEPVKGGEGKEKPRSGSKRIFKLKDGTEIEVE